MRVYQGDSTIPKDARPHTFIEIEPNAFLEITLPHMESLRKGELQRLRAFIRKTRQAEKKENSYHIRLHRRFFQTLHPIPNLRLIGQL